MTRISTFKKRATLYQHLIKKTLDKTQSGWQCTLVECHVLYSAAKLVVSRCSE